MCPSPDVHPLARKDYLRQLEYLNQVHVGPDTEIKFLAALTTARNKIRDNPTMWNFIPGSRRIRRVQIPEFRMQAFYFIQKNGVPLILEFAGPGLQPRWPGRL